jgi:UPF0716 protein FxsA
MPFFIIFLSIPLIELALFIIIGGEIGVGPTLLLVVGAAVLGSFIIQNQGISVLDATRKSLDQGRLPQQSLFETLCNVLGGLLLIIPGFFSDMLAVALLVPAVRNYFRRRMARHFNIDMTAQADIIAGEYEIVDEPPPPRPRLPDLEP